MLEMVFHLMAIHQNFIKINNHEIFDKCSKNLVHCCMKVIEVLNRPKSMIAAYIALSKF